MSKTKIVGVMILVVAVLKVVIDVLDGGGFDYKQHFDALITGLGGVGLFFLRDALTKVLTILKK